MSSEDVPGYTEKADLVRRVYASTLKHSPGDQSPEARRWRQIALQQQIHLAEETGIYGHAFTEQELAKARRDAAEVTRPDPVEAILGIPGDASWDEIQAAEQEELDWLNYLKNESVLNKFQEVAEALSKLWNDTAEAFKPMLEAIEKASVKVTPLIQVKFDQQVQQLRHGSAAICPRHGPTRGGTCLKCR